MNKISTTAKDDVLTFYNKRPINATEEPETAAAFIMRKNSIECIYSNIEDFYESDIALEFRCDTGWLSNSIILNVDVNFQCMDLFQCKCAPKNIVTLNGAVHHTSDVKKRGGVLRCAELMRRVDRIFIGLYYKYGRKYYLNYFRGLKERDLEEETLFNKYGELDGRHVDNIQLRSWFSDQALYPYETQHMLKEIVEIFREPDVQLFIGASINNYGELDNIAVLYDVEEQLYDVGGKNLESGSYYPGFFYVTG